MAVEKRFDFLRPQQVRSPVVIPAAPRLESKRCVGRLECSRLALTRQTDVEHVAYLRRKFGVP